MRRVAQPSRLWARGTLVSEQFVTLQESRLIRARIPPYCSEIVVSLDPTAVLGRGYSITRNAGGVLVRDSSQVSAGERIITTLAKGNIESEILKKAR